VRSWTLLAGGAPILTGPSWLRGRLQGGETTTFGFNNIKIMRQRNAVANTWSNMHVEPAAWLGNWGAQLKIMKINKLWKLIKIKTERKLSYTSLPVKLGFWRVFFISEHKVNSIKGKGRLQGATIYWRKWKLLKFHRHLWILSKINPEDLKKDNLY